jgi:hypothetical protein
MGKPTTERYHPGNLPDDAQALIPFLFDELWRIAQAISGHIVGMNVVQTGLIIPIAAVPVTQQLFLGELPLSDLPGGAWDPATGSYTVPENGQYQLSIDCVVYPFGAGNKLYSGDVFFLVEGIELWRSTTSGDDDLKLGISISVGARLLAGQVLTAWITLEHDQFAGDVTVDSYMSINQTSSE